jgi:glutamyl-tRNA(Gln) amidotransferase subunit E
VKVGLEVHQQLSTGKLFCACPCELSEEVRHSFARRLRAAGGENRAVDAAAAFQAERGLLYSYESTPSDCLVEMDEEPPRPLNAEALETALQLALLLEARPVDEVEVMRKIVVDGSNTSGFQRTALIATGGHLDVGGRRHAIDTICLEEDAARKISDSKEGVTFRLDRLGIPLIEIATGPDIADGREAREVAEEIGALLRATGRVRRGIGTIREDLNVSTEGVVGSRSRACRSCGRSRSTPTARSNANTPSSPSGTSCSSAARVGANGVVHDVTPVVGDLSSGPLAGARKKGHVVLSITLPGFANLLRSGTRSDERLGRELADQARAAGLGGLLHSDELPGHGLGPDDVDRLRRALALGETDGFVLVVDRSRDRAEAALRRIASRATAALEGIPGETRDPLPDGRTRYSRPLPGRDRMYPETDVPPVLITPERLEELRSRLPERPSAQRERLVSAYQLPPELARQLVASGDAETLEDLVHRGRSPGLAARLLTQDLPAARSAAAARPEPTVSVDGLNELLSAAESGRFSKEGIPAVLGALFAGSPTLDAALDRAGLTGPGVDDLDAVAERVVRANATMVHERGEAAFSPLMGDVMREVRGRRDGKEVADALRRAISRLGAGNGP